MVALVVIAAHVEKRTVHHGNEEFQILLFQVAAPDDQSNILRQLLIIKVPQDLALDVGDCEDPHADASVFKPTMSVSRRASSFRASGDGMYPLIFSCSAFIRMISL